MLLKTHEIDGFMLDRCSQSKISGGILVEINPWNCVQNCMSMCVCEFSGDTVIAFIRKSLIFKKNVVNHSSKKKNAVSAKIISH